MTLFRNFTGAIRRSSRSWSAGARCADGQVMRLRALLILAAAAPRQQSRCRPACPNLPPF
jgi:hypothetical protein